MNCRRRVARVKPPELFLCPVPSLRRVVGVVLFFVQKPRRYSRANASLHYLPYLRGPVELECSTISPFAVVIKHHSSNRRFQRTISNVGRPSALLIAISFENPIALNNDYTGESRSRWMAFCNRRRVSVFVNTMRKLLQSNCLVGWKWLETLSSPVCPLRFPVEWKAASLESWELWNWLYSRAAWGCLLDCY